MNTMLELRQQHIHATELPVLRPLDRLALRIGLVLVRWSQRTERTGRDPAVRHTTNPALEQAVHRRELLEATHRLTRPAC